MQVPNSSSSISPALSSSFLWLGKNADSSFLRLRGKFFVFKVCAQGAAASPLVGARTAALVSRLTQYMFLDTELAIEVFVDDPCLTVTGSLAQRNKSIAIVILFWQGPTVKWIGSYSDRQTRNWR